MALATRGRTVAAAAYSHRDRPVLLGSVLVKIDSSTEPGMVRVRFAPSPTGELHVGSAWTALFNWLFAKHNHGTFILRIEDTDRDRLVPGAVDRIYELLEWLKLKPDEGPREGGQYGPYAQSERLGRYRDAANALLTGNSAYRCFCTSTRLQQLRAQQQGRGLPPMYDRRCRNIPKEESDRRAASEPFVVRLAVPLEGSTIASDEIRGQVEWGNATLDDAVLFKSDGYPTYHLANVVDDHAMEISHVIRAEEWLPSLPKHIILYTAFGWKPPTFAHLPLILGPDRKKLSKRHGHAAALDYRDSIRPTAFVNFLALLGWRPPKSDQELFTREELVERFDLSDVRKSGAVFDTQKLLWLNVQWIRRELPSTLREMVATTPPMITQDEANLVIGNEHFGHLVTERAGVYGQVRDRIYAILRPPPLDGTIQDTLVSKPGSVERTKQILEILTARLQATERWDTMSISYALSAAGEGSEAPPAQVHWVFRIALNHVNPSPPGTEIALALGRTMTVKRLQEAFKTLVGLP